MGMALAAAAASPGPWLCEHGHRQSPIDIVPNRHDRSSPLSFDYRSATLRIVNDGHTVRVRFSNGSRMFVGAEALVLQQFHFHIPAGDKVRGTEFPMAMHFLHKSRSGQLVSLVVLFRLGTENPTLAELLPLMPSSAGGEQPVPAREVNPASLLPAERGYFAYDGSLTAAPCTEGVRWIVMQHPLELSAGQLAALSRLFPPNGRPVQPRHGRVVIEAP